jgi:hypothetical protein
MDPIPQGSIPRNTEIVLTIILSAWFAGLIVWGLIDRRTYASRKLVLLVAACTLAAFAEAPYDLFINLQYFHGIDEWVVYSAFGRDISVWTLLMYPTWVTTMGYLTLRLLERGGGVRSLWKLYLGLVAFDYCGEFVFTQNDFFVYFGHQPLKIFEVSMVWPWIWTASFMTVGLIVHRFREQLSGPRQLLFLPVAGSTILGGAAFAGWPTILGIGMRASTPELSTLSLISIAIALGTFHSMASWACAHDEMQHNEHPVLSGGSSGPFGTDLERPTSEEPLRRA